MFLLLLICKWGNCNRKTHATIVRKKYLWNNIKFLQDSNSLKNGSSIRHPLFLQFCSINKLRGKSFLFNESWCLHFCEDDVLILSEDKQDLNTVNSTEFIENEIWKENMVNFQINREVNYIHMVFLSMLILIFRKNHSRNRFWNVILY